MSSRSGRQRTAAPSCLVFAALRLRRRHASTTPVGGSRALRTVATLRSTRANAEGDMHAYKGITLRQPMAMLIMAGIKDVENRFLKVTYRGPLLIHVSRTTTDIDPHAWGPHTRAAMKTLGFDANDADCGARLKAKLTPTLGHVVGVVDLVDVVDNSRSKWASRDSEAHWLIRNPRALLEPFEAPGNTSMVNFATKEPIRLVDGSVLPAHDAGAAVAV
ncbi:MAG TPA: hypothetical protein VGF99_05240, partial [Myxococcota bacterium]